MVGEGHALVFVNGRNADDEAADEAFGGEKRCLVRGGGGKDLEIGGEAELGPVVRGDHVYFTLVHESESPALASILGELDDPPRKAAESFQFRDIRRQSRFVRQEPTSRLCWNGCRSTGKQMLASRATIIT